jgi:hypothetical protein
LLIFLADELYANKYGTFIGNCERDRHQMLKVVENTESIWTYVMLEKPRFTNKYYNPEATKDIIEQVPLTAPFCMQEWREHLYRWSRKSHNCYYQDLKNDKLAQNSFVATQLEQTKLDKIQLLDLLK